MLDVPDSFLQLDCKKQCPVTQDIVQILKLEFLAVCTLLAYSHGKTTILIMDDALSLPNSPYHAVTGSYDDQSMMPMVD